MGNSAKTILILSIVNISLKAYSQEIVAVGQINQFVVVSPNFTYLTSSNSDAYPIKNTKNRPIKYEDFVRFGGSIKYMLDVALRNHVSLSSSIEYLYVQSELQIPCYCFHTFDRNVVLSNVLSMHSLDLPVNLKLKTNKTNYTYLLTGFGASFILSSFRRIEKVEYILTSPSTTNKVLLFDESYKLRNSGGNPIGSYYQFSLGQMFQINKNLFFAEMTYRKDLNFWAYKTIETQSGIKEFPFKRNVFSLGIGIKVEL
jgi:hypothetical protein